MAMSSCVVVESLKAMDPFLVWDRRVGKEGKEGAVKFSGFIGQQPIESRPVLQIASVELHPKMGCCSSK